MIAYKMGVYDTLRGEDLQKLDRAIQQSIVDNAEAFAIVMYDDELCENLGIGKPLKTIEDRKKIAEFLRGVDFVVPIFTLERNVIEARLREEYEKYIESKNVPKSPIEKPYELGYAPGTYDLFHAGHLENLVIAANQCKRLIVGVKADELVFEHKQRNPYISDDERMEILRYFRFVDGVYRYYIRDLYSAVKNISEQYGHDVDAIFLGDDLRKDFAEVQGLNIVYTDRDAKKMATRSTTGYLKLILDREHRGRYTGSILRGRQNGEDEIER